MADSRDYCVYRLPNGETVGQFVRRERSFMDAAAKSDQFGVLPAFAGAAMPYGPMDFKNRFKGQADAVELGRAGNFAYYATGDGFVPRGLLDFGARGYAQTMKAMGQKPASGIEDGMSNNAKAVRDKALAARGCPQ